MVPIIFIIRFFKKRKFYLLLRYAQYPLAFYCNISKIYLLPPLALDAPVQLLQKGSAVHPH